jgi:ABC-2 type transport system permease protein
MQSKNWFFNRALFLKNITRYWPVWVLSTLGWLVGMPMVLASSVVNGGEAYLQMRADSVVMGWAEMCYWVAAVDAIVCAMAVFSYRFQHRSAVAMHMMPLRRECLFFTNYLSGLALMLGPMVANLLVLIGVEGVLGCLNLTVLAMWFTAQAMASLFFFALAVFCAELTGNLVMFPCLYVGIQLVPLLLDEMITTLCDTLLLGFTSFPMMDSAAQWLSPFWNMMNSVQSVWRQTGDTTRQYFLQGWGCLVAYLLAGILLFLAGLLLYRRHRVETAGDVIAIFQLRPVFRCLLTILCAVGMGWLVTELTFSDQIAVWSWKHVLIYLVSLLAGGFLGYLAAQMLLNKSLNVFHAGWAGYVGCMLALIVAVCGLKIDLLHFATWLPDPECVESIDLSGGITVSGENAIEVVSALHTSIVNNLAEQQQLVKEYYAKANSVTYDSEGNGYIDGQPEEQWSETHGIRTIKMTYHLEGGITRARAYTVYIDQEQLDSILSPASWVQELMQQPEYETEYYAFIADAEVNDIEEVNLFTYELVGRTHYSETYVTLQGDDAIALLHAMQEDLASETTVCLWARYEMRDKTYEWSNLGISVKANGLHGMNSYYENLSDDWYDLELNPTWTNTLAELEALGVVDDNHILAGEDIIGDRDWVDTDCRYDNVNHVYVE